MAFAPMSRLGTPRSAAARRIVLTSPSKIRLAYNSGCPGGESHNPFAEHLVFSGEQVLHKIVTAFIRVARRAGEMMIDSHPG